MGEAKFVKELSGFTGRAELYRLSPPLTDMGWHEKEPGTAYEYVVVSATLAMFSGPETYIFGANEDGKVLAWGELDGSYRGGLDIAEALRRAGYDIVSEEAENVAQ